MNSDQKFKWLVIKLLLAILKCHARQTYDSSVNAMGEFYCNELENGRKP